MSNVYNYGLRLKVCPTEHAYGYQEFLTDMPCLHGQFVVVYRTYISIRNAEWHMERLLP